MRVLNYTATLEPINKAYIVSVFEGGSGRTRRLARWIAHAIITDNAVSSVCIRFLSIYVRVTQF
jgi:hypothetical protein